MVWKLEAPSEDSDELPVTELRVHYVRKELIDNAVASNFQELADNREAVWANEGRVKHLKKCKFHGVLSDTHRDLFFSS